VVASGIISLVAAGEDATAAGGVEIGGTGSAAGVAVAVAADVADGAPSCAQAGSANNNATTAAMYMRVIGFPFPKNTTSRALRSRLAGTTRAAGGFPQRTPAVRRFCGE
jgi:hypothetical protein